MKLVAITALLAVCGAAKLDRAYLPPSSAATAGGSPESLQTPFSRSSSDQGKLSDVLPTGSYTNDFQGVVVDAAASGIRASPGSDLSGLGGPRDSYGSENSKVGDAAFRASITGFRNTQNLGSGLNGQVSGINAGQNFGPTESKSERPQAFKDRNSNIISYANDISIDNYSYGFESDNGIAVGENGVANNGIQKQGGYSYQGDDGQVYKVTYVADEGGYRPQGAHLPTPPPIPKEILESLEQNAKDEAAGLIDDGSYDAQKYNAEGDYTHHNGGNIQYNGAHLSQVAKRPESDATASNTFINQNSQAFGRPGQLSNDGAQNTHTNFNGQSNQFSSNFAYNQDRLVENQNKQIDHVISGHQQSSTTHHGSGHFGQNSDQLGQTQDALGSLNAQSEYQNNQQVPNTQFGTQSIQFGSQANQQGSFNQLGGQTNQKASAEPSLGQSSNSAYNSPLSQGTQFGNHASKPQSSLSSTAQVQNAFGQLPQYSNNKQENSLATQTQFANAGLSKPFFGSFVNNKPGQGQIGNKGNHFSNTQNQFGAEYLPPSNSNNVPSFNKPQKNEASSSNDANRDNQIPNFIALEGQNPGSSASAFASVSSAGFGTQPARPFDAFQTETPRPNQFNYNNNNQVTSLEQTQSIGLPNSSEHSAFNAVPTKPTSVPQTELSTPFESNEKPIYSQGSQVNGQSASSFGIVGPQSINNQAQSQTGFEGNFATAVSQQFLGHTSSYPDSRPQGTSQFDSSSPTLSTFPALQRPGSDEKITQFSQNTGSLNQENNLNANQQQNNVYYSAQKPSFSQGPDDSYYYNQPSKPFGIPAAYPQGSRFPSSPSYQSNSVVSSQNNKFSNQQGSFTSSTKFPISSSMISVVPTPISQVTQNQNNAPANYYNGITQASISPFPPVSSTTSTQYDTNQFGSNSIYNQPSVPQPQSNKPTTFQQNFGAPSFPTKPGTALAQNPSTSFSQNQDQFEQNTLPNNNNQTQQYQGTVYEYNKPAEVLPAPEKTGSFSSQSVQSNLPSKTQGQVPNIQESKPQFGSQQAQSGTLFQQPNLNQGSKPQFSTQTFKPFDASSTNNSQISHSTQSNLQHNTPASPGNVPPVHSSKPSLLATPQFTQSSQISSASRPQFSSQPSKPFGSTPTLSQVGQNTQQPQGTVHTAGSTSTLQIQGLQSNEQPFKPQSGAQSTTSQFGQNTQATFGSIAMQQNSGPLLTTQPNKPSYGTSSPSNYGQATQTQGSQNTGFASTQINSQNSQIGAQTIKPFGMTETRPSFPGYPSSKPQFDTQFTQNPFSHSFQQNFGATQINSQPTAGPQNGGQQFGNAPSIHGSPDSQKPQFGQHVNNQGTEFTGSSFVQQKPLQSSQFVSSASKPQLGTQTQFTQNQNPSSTKPFNNASAQTQFTQNTAQSPSSTVTQQKPQSTQTYKPFNKSSSDHSQNKPQFDQASQLSQSVSTTTSPLQFGVQAFNPFGSSGTQEPQNNHQTKPFNSQQGRPCCQGSKDSSIRPLNVGKPSQAFAQTQSQFAAIQGVQSLNAQSVAGKGEEFSGPREPPSFDAQTGYHY